MTDLSSHGSRHNESWSSGLRRTLAGHVFRLARPLLWRLDLDQSRSLATLAVRLGLVPAMVDRQRSELTQTLWGLEFLNPVGLAAGYDKRGTAYEAFLRLGFSFVEVGTVTPLPQAGNPQPNFVALPEDSAVINRMGFPNPGHEAVLKQLRNGRSGIVGVNIGPNRDSTDRMSDYVRGIEAFTPLCDYITINVSSPNTAGLRNLQSRSALEELLEHIADARRRCERKIPVLIKIAPDVSDSELQDIAELCLQGGIDGIIVANTTLSRPPLKSSGSTEPGGLSGPPLFDLSTRKLARLQRLTGGAIPLIGVGGIDSAETAWQKIRAGASLLQIATAFRFKGPGLLSEIDRGLRERLRSHGYASIAEAVGTGAQEWAEAAPPSPTTAGRAA